MRNSATSHSESSHAWYLKLPFVCFCCKTVCIPVEDASRLHLSVFVLFEFFSSGFFICVMTHPYSFQWTWRKWHPILSCSGIWYITLLQPQRDTVLSKSALLYKNRPWPRGISVIKRFWNGLQHIYLWLASEITKFSSIFSVLFIWIMSERGQVANQI